MGFLELAKANPLRSLKTILCCLSFGGIGAYMSIFGPTLLDLQVLTQVTIEEIALVLPARSAGYAVGSVIVGLIGEVIDQQIIVMVCLLMNIFTSFSISYTYAIKLMYINAFTAGLGSGAIDTVGNVWIIHMWGKENPPFLQLMYFSYGIGAFIIPFASEPFLLKKTNEMENDFISPNFTSNITIKNSYSPEDLRLQWPYSFITIYSLIVLLILGIVYIKNPSNEPHSSRKPGADNEISKDKWSLKKPVEKKMKALVISLATLFMHAFIGLEVSFGSLLATYAVKSNLRLSESDGSILSGLYWAAFTFFRVFTFVLINIFSPQQLLIMCLAVIMLSNVFLLPFANNYAWALWVGSIIMGFGCSSPFATMFAFLDHLTPITPKITAGFLVSASIGEFIIPYIVGIYIETKPEVYLYIVFIYSSLCVIFFALLVYILSFLHKKESKEAKIEISCITQQ